MKKLLMLSLLAGMMMGCDKFCKVSVDQLATIQNNTGRDMTLSICKNDGTQSTLRLLPTTSGIVKVGTREESKAQGMGTCSAGNKKDTTARISLSPMSFGSVLFCYRQYDNTYVVASPYQGCPMNYDEQTSTGPCEQFR